MSSRIKPSPFRGTISPLTPVEIRATERRATPVGVNQPISLQPRQPYPPEAFYQYLPGTGSTAARHYYRGQHGTPFLVDGCSLSGQVWNASEFARSFGVADTTVRRYLDILTATFMLRLLPPWTENLRKRQVKAPKLYVADSGLLHTLLDLTEKHDLEGHPKVGASWEGFLLEEVIRQLGAPPEQCYFWATHAGAELDLLVVRGRERYGFEFKRTVAPTLSRSMHTALADLMLTRLDLIHAGQETFPLAPQVRAVAAARLTEDIEPFDR